MLDIPQFRRTIVRPVLEQMGLHSQAAGNLLIGTALHESALTYFRQIGGGPALGLYQMEPATHDDIWANFLSYKPALAASVRWWLAGAPEKEEQLVWNLAYATAMCRIHYFRVPHPLPDASNLGAIAAYWKTHYNTAAGVGKEVDFVRTYNKHMRP